MAFEEAVASVDDVGEAATGPKPLRLLTDPFENGGMPGNCKEIFGYHLRLRRHCATLESLLCYGSASSAC